VRPLPGPQTLFARSAADVCFFASQPGAGKSMALCMEALRWAHKPNYTGVLMRSSFKDLVRGPTSLFGTLSHLGRQMGGKPRQAPHPSVEFKSPSSILCLHGGSDKESFDGLEIAMLGLDEAAHFDLPLVQYIMGSRMRTTCGIRPYVRGSVMPTTDNWIHDLVKPWLDGKYAKPEESGKVRWFFWDNRNLPQIFDTLEDAKDAAHVVDPAIIPRSLAFVFAKTADNSVLMKADPEYVQRLAMLPVHERERLLHGSWEARPDSAGMFDRACWKVRDHAPNFKEIKESVRGWDLAATKPSDTSPDPDWTRGIKLDVLLDGSVCVSDVVSLRDRPGPVDDLIRATARQDGPRVVQAFCRDPGGAGVRDEQHIRDLLAKTSGTGPIKVQPSANKESLAKVWSAHLSAGNMWYARAAWNGPYLSELDAFPSKAHDDQVDATSYAFRELSGIGTGLTAAQRIVNAMRAQ
jgi:predicted phage terminase large subunit-like protein